MSQPFDLEPAVDFLAQSSSCLAPCPWEAPHDSQRFEHEDSVRPTNGSAYRTSRIVENPYEPSIERVNRNVRLCGGLSWH
jgi:hypothetical protein